MTKIAVTTSRSIANATPRLTKPGVRDGLRARGAMRPGAWPALERSVRLVGAAPEVGHDLIAEVRPLLRERLAQRRARDDAMEGGFELGAREDGLDELRRLPVVERLARDAFHHLVLHERAADRLGQRPCERAVECPSCFRCREHALGHPLEPPARVELGLTARRRQHVDAAPDERQPFDDAHRPEHRPAGSRARAAHRHRQADHHVAPVRRLRRHRPTLIAPAPRHLV